MKSVYGVVLILGLVALAHGFPGANRQSAASSEVDDSKDDGIILAMPGSRPSIFSGFFDDSDDDSDDDSMDGMWPSFSMNRNPFNELYARMQDTMNRIRAQMAAALNGQGFGQAGLTPWGKIPEGANTTSTTKVIDGHAVTINETTYTDGDDNSGTIIRVRVVDIKPLNETTQVIPNEENNNNNENNDNNNDNDDATTIKPKEEEADENTGSEQVEKEREELTTPKTRETETLEDFNNEIPKNQFETLDA